MLKKKKAFKILLFLLVLLGGVLLPNFTFNAAEEDFQEFNLVVVLEGENVEINTTYFRIVYNIGEDYTLSMYGSNYTYAYLNTTQINLLGSDETLYCVNAIVNGYNIIINDIIYFDTFLDFLNQMNYNSGYSVGFNNGESTNADIQYSEGFNNGYNEGFNVGSSSGFNNGYNEGLTVGYNNGFMEGQTSNADNFSLLSLLSIILMYPFKVIALGMDVNIFGVNVGGLIIGLLAIGLVVGIIAIFTGGKNEK